jgi:UDP-N-acetylmuramate dehydrogenase
MEIKQDYDLTKLNTFGIAVRAKFFVEVESEAELAEIFALPEFKENKRIFLGGGSNILFTRDFDGIAILNKLKGIEITNDDSESVVVRALSGEWWHDLVLFTVDREYWGIENLAYVPGTVGAAPMQNIGAYGGELKNTLESVEAIDIESGEKRIFSKEECKLGYRDSVFKNELKDKYFIVAVTLKLSKTPKPNLSYKILKEYLENNPPAGGEVKSSKDISEAVTAIRKSKLPDPSILGNAGSFFKNVFIEKEKFENLQKEYPDIPCFTEGEEIKIPTAWLVEQCGYKGKRGGNAGVHDKQALVLVNLGGATGEEIKNLSEEIIASVYKKFGLKIAPEVNLI